MREMCLFSSRLTTFGFVVFVSRFLPDLAMLKKLETIHSMLIMLRNLNFIDYYILFYEHLFIFFQDKYSKKQVSITTYL